MQDLLAYWMETIQTDLGGFSDPGVPVKMDIDGRTLSARWQIKDQPQHDKFRLNDAGDLRWVRPETDGEFSYPQFLKSHRIADLQQLAKATLRTYKPASAYVFTRAALDDTDSETPVTQGAADKLIADLIAAAGHASSGRTQLLFIKGDAGAGKTTLLEYMTRLQAERYLAGESDFLFLHVSAQGRALSRLSDAFAEKTGTLRASFTWDGVAPLTRHGLLVPIVDGFDELLGSAGYGDAFSSLRDFLGSLAGSGLVIASARSSFFDVEFSGRRSLESADASFRVVPLTLNRWGDNEFTEYLRKVRDGNETQVKADLVFKSRLTQADSSLLGKPFFAAKFIDYMDAVNTGKFGGSLFDYLIESFLERESGKIVDRNQKPLLSAEGHRRLFAEIVDHMWTAELRHISPDDMRTLAELVGGEQGLSSDDAKQLVAKVTSYAGFASADRGNFQFEHDVYFDYFLASAIRRALSPSDFKLKYLDRGLLSADVAEAVVRNSSDADLVLSRVLPVEREGVLLENRRRNTGTLVAAAICALGELRAQTLKQLTFLNSSLAGVSLVDVVFEGCTLRGVDLRDAKLTNCTVSETDVFELRLSKTSEIDTKGMAPGFGLHSLRLDNQDMYSPGDMIAALRKLGCKDERLAEDLVRYDDAATATIDLLYLLARKYMRTNVLCVEDRNCETPPDARRSFCAGSYCSKTCSGSRESRTCRGGALATFGGSFAVPRDSLNKARG